MSVSVSVSVGACGVESGTESGIRPTEWHGAPRGAREIGILGSGLDLTGQSGRWGKSEIWVGGIIRGVRGGLSTRGSKITSTSSSMVHISRPSEGRC